MNVVDKSEGPLQLDGREPARKAVMQIVNIVGPCAFGAAVLCAVLGSGWAGAVAACGLSLMGAVASFVVVKYT
jgi:hypothetical protein